MKNHFKIIFGHIQEQHKIFWSAWYKFIRSVKWALANPDKAKERYDSFIETVFNPLIEAYQQQEEISKKYFALGITLAKTFKLFWEENGFNVILEEKETWERNCQYITKIMKEKEDEHFTIPSSTKSSQDSVN